MLDRLRVFASAVNRNGVDWRPMSDVRAPIHPIAQRPGSKQCWAAVIVMMRGLQGNNDQALIDQIIAEGRPRGVHPSVFTGALDPVTGGQTLASAFGFAYTDLRSGPLQDGNFFADFLRHGSPFGLFGHLPTYGLHAVAIYRVSGDFSSLSTSQAYGVDSRGPSRFQDSLFNLVNPTVQRGAQMQGHFILHR